MENDLISRQAVLGMANTWTYNFCDPEDEWAAMKEIRDLPSAQPERQINLDGFETPIEILSELRSQFNCFDGQEEKAYHALSVAIHALSAQPDWIPVSERLPELDEAVLATTAWNDITIAWRIGICKWFIHEGNTNAETDDIIAWMPLPLPYKGEQE